MKDPTIMDLFKTNNCGSFQKTYSMHKKVNTINPLFSSSIISLLHKFHRHHHQYEENWDIQKIAKTLAFDMIVFNREFYKILGDQEKSTQTTKNSRFLIEIPFVVRHSIIV